MRLTEVAAVLVIYACLAGIVSPASKKQISTTQNIVLAYNVKVLQQAVEIYRLEKGGYPDDLHCLVDTGYFRELPINLFTGAISYQYSRETGKVLGLQP